MEIEFYAMAQGKIDYSIKVIRINYEKYGDMIQYVQKTVLFTSQKNRQ